MASEYIERTTALNIVKGNWMFMTSADDATQKSIEMIRRLPVADVRPVVRCKDCKNYIKRSGACAYLVVGMREDDFCSYGKKREES